MFAVAHAVSRSRVKPTPLFDGSMHPLSDSQRRSAGFTYLGLVFAVLLVGLGLAAAGMVWSLAAQREKERQLLWVGQQYRNAIASYYLRGASGVRQFPVRLEDLLEDRRGAAVQRHLRRLYADPVMGSTDWELLRIPLGGITGLRSRAQAQPLKRRNFPAGEEVFEDASCYCEWVLEFVPPLRTAPQPARDST
jgi:type II secretory pathway pseudopilin PulG